MGEGEEGVRECWDQGDDRVPVPLLREPVE